MYIKTLFAQLFIRHSLIYSHTVTISFFDSNAKQEIQKILV